MLPDRYSTRMTFLRYQLLRIGNDRDEGLLALNAGSEIPSNVYTEKHRMRVRWNAAVSQNCHNAVFLQTHGL